MLRCLLLAALIGLSLSHAVHPTKKNSIRHMEGLVFKHHQLLHPHTKKWHTSPFNVPFFAFGRNFTLNMRPHTALFAEDAKMVVRGDNGIVEESYLTHDGFFTGTIAGEADSFVHMTISETGTVNAVLAINDHGMTINPAHEHFDTPQDFDHVVFRDADMDMPETSLIDSVLAADGPKIVEAQPQRARRAVFNPLNTACKILLVADHRFYSIASSSDTVLARNLMISRFAVAQSKFSATVLGATAANKNITLMVGGIEVRTTATTLEQKTTPGTYLNEFSRGLYNAYCLAHAFTSYNYQGTLGLAWKGATITANQAGGICQQRVTIDGVQVNYNTGFSTSINFGNTVPEYMHGLVTTHEFGHNFGSDHDEQTATPPPGGQYIMYPYAQSGDDTNNDKFSSASKSQMTAVVVDKGGCFVATSSTTCGNTVQEGSEACDCGSSAGTCHDIDSCCNTNLQCVLEGSASCSPLHSTNGRCCTSGCAFQPSNTECQDQQACKLAAKCNGGGVCQAAANKPDNTLCEPSALTCSGTSCSKLCNGGSCTTSICTLWPGAIECPTVTTGENACIVSCQQSGTCKSTSHLTGSPAANAGGATSTTTDYVHANGASCEYTSGDPSSGYCSDGVCIQVGDHQSTLNNVLGDLGLSSSDIQNWFTGKSAGLPRYAWFIIAGCLFVGIMYVIYARIRRTADAPMSRNKKGRVV